MAARHLKPRKSSFHRSSPALPRRNLARSAREFRFLYKCPSSTIGGGDGDHDIGEDDDDGDDLESKRDTWREGSGIWRG